MEGNCLNYMEELERLYRAYSGYVYTLAFRVIGNEEEARDVVQDVFMNVHKNLKRFGFRSSIKTWIHRITVNTAINASRKRSREMGRRSDYEVVIAKENVPDETGAGIEKEDSQKRISDLLCVLNADQRACLVLREMEGLNYKEIAETLKVNINTVRSRLKRARQIIVDSCKKEVVCDGLL